MSSTIERAELAIVERLISADQLDQALTRERAVSTMRLGTRLLELNLITEDQLKRALQAQASNPARHLGEILLDLGLVSRPHLNQVLCEKLGIPLVDLAHFRIDPIVLRMLPEDLVRRAQVVPLCYVEGKLVVAVSDPLDSGVIERVRFFVQGPVTPVMATREEIDDAIRTLYGAEVSPRDTPAMAKPARIEPRDADLQLEITPVEDAEISVVAIVDKMISDACSTRASAIHIDASYGTLNVVIRMRAYGELSEYLILPGHARSALVTRIKTIAGIDIAERRRAQEGRIDVVEQGASVHLRVITVPTRDGNEDIAIEVLAARQALPLQTLGVREPVLESIRQLVARRYGLIVVAGPAGSGKTTMLHALLTLLDAAQTKIWTVENPVEITRSGLSQVEVNTKIGWDYAAIMRAVSRADPDVIMIGEMRDRETAVNAVEASLKRCLVLGALHGSGAVEAVARLLDMGVDAFGLSDALLGAVGQRLARRLCLKCRTSRTATPAEVDALLREYCEGTALDPSQVRVEWYQRYNAAVPVYEAKGCSACNGTGHYGHIGFHELVLGGPAMRHLLLQRRPLDELMTAAIRGGMRTLKQDGIEKALAGHCDLREVRTATL